MTSDTRPIRRAWSWPERLAYWLYNFFIGPFLTKLRDDTIMGSMTRWAVFVFMVAEAHRLYMAPMGSVTLPEAFVVFCILFALAIDSKLNEAPADVVVRAVTGMLSQGADAVRSYWSGSAPSGGEVLSGDALMPPVAHGRADEGQP